VKKTIKPLLICCAVVLAIAMGYLGRSQHHQTDVTVTDLLQTADADAECEPYNGWLYGRCLTLSGVCVFDTCTKE
jgi:hypothetical protein